MRTKWEGQVIYRGGLRQPLKLRAGKLPPLRRRRRRGRREASIEESCRLVAKNLGWESRKMNGLGFRDWPDRLFIPPRPVKPMRRAFWVEFKRLGEEPTPAQGKRIEDLRRRGERVYVCDNVPGFKSIIRAEG